MNRADWQQIAEERAKDALALIAASQWSGAYYLAGYAIECGLKSCVLRRLSVEPEVIFDEKRFSEKCWTHNLDELVTLANLGSILDADVAANAVLSDNWETAKKWTEQDRYRMKTEAEARGLVVAVTDNVNGVLPWIKNHW